MKKITILLISLFMMLTLTGCLQKESPSQVLEKEFDSVIEEYKNKDINEIIESYGGEDSAIVYVFGGKEGVQNLMDVIYDFDYEIGDANIEKDNAEINVTIKTHDISSAIDNAFGDITFEIINDAISDLLSGSTKFYDPQYLTTYMFDKLSSKLKETFEKEKGNEKTKLDVLTFELEKINGEWKISESTNIKEKLLEIYNNALVEAVQSVQTNLNEVGEKLSEYFK